MAAMGLASQMMARNIVRNRRRPRRPQATSIGRGPGSGGRVSQPGQLSAGYARLNDPGTPVTGTPMSFSPIEKLRRPNQLGGSLGSGGRVSLW